jgi:hypothetical protein
VRPDVEVHIEELVLQGFAPGERYRIAEAIQHELQRLFTDESLPSCLTESRDISRFDGGSFHVTSGAGLETIGSQLGQAIYDCFGNASVKRS